MFFDGNISTTTTSSWYPGQLEEIEYKDEPIFEHEKNGIKYLQYELIGLGEEHIHVEKEFLNKEKQTFLNVKGEFKDADTGFENEINIHLFKRML
jgi:hypothetical protein